MNIEDLNTLIISMHKKGAIHKRRGFKLSDATTEIATNHLLEEAVELQAEMHSGNFRSQIDEAADVLGVFLHLLWIAGIPLRDVSDRCHRKMVENFTLDPSEVVATTPGFTRTGR